MDDLERDEEKEELDFPGLGKSPKKGKKDELEVDEEEPASTIESGEVDSLDALADEEVEEEDSFDDDSDKDW